ncbi:MAG: FAD-binding oxidoreductase [Alicyclobacillaceae bacterium]|uniref:NAD(P)/FAD-dependent oxidoreductase n=1 Tax=Alicyclobacillus sp. SP_1 TaxID=2942475 RepID=UPI002157A569|nr:FAD-binding oxidoreductase [Alicyclobacillus sp. SP_1]MCY0889297.1 FAD-binding oxidoreductase [Alicyclobacillaceae bacterium]
MDLTTGKLLWLDAYPNHKHYPSLEEDLDCDVAVVGAGEAGAICSWYLHHAGLNVVLVDKRPVGCGSSSANTGLVQYANDTSLCQLIERHGEEKAVRFYRLCQSAIDELEQITFQLPETTEWRRRESLYFASTKHDVHALEREYEALVHYGFPVQYLSPVEIRAHFPFEQPAALWTSNDAEMNPFRLTHAICSALESDGMKIYEDTNVVQVCESHHRPTLLTSQKRKIRARFVVFAVGYESEEQHHFPGSALQSTYAIATEPVSDLSDWHRRCLIWETARPYLYLRTTADNRIIVGGLDIPVADGPARDKKLLEKTDQLKQRLNSLFPRYKDARVEYRWAATFGNSLDGLPLIGRHPQHPCCYVALGYGGNGTVYYTIAAHIIRDSILNGTHPEDDLFAPTRMTWMPRWTRMFF